MHRIDAIANVRAFAGGSSAVCCVAANGKWLAADRGRLISE